MFCQFLVSFFRKTFKGSQNFLISESTVNLRGKPFFKGFFKYMVSRSYEFYTWTSGNPWQKEMIDAIITLITCLMCNLRTRNRLQTKTLNQETSFVKGYPQCEVQLHTMLRGTLNVRFNFIPCQHVEKMEGNIFFRVKFGQ